MKDFVISSLKNELSEEKNMRMKLQEELKQAKDTSNSFEWAANYYRDLADEMHEEYELFLELDEDIIEDIIDDTIVLVYEKLEATPEYHHNTRNALAEVINELGEMYD
ncbi:MAG: hypothetical protein R8M45_03680 [Ghiorsea sp.]